MRAIRRVIGRSAASSIAICIVSFCLATSGAGLEGNSSDVARPHSSIEKIVAQRDAQEKAVSSARFVLRGEQVYALQAQPNPSGTPEANATSPVEEMAGVESVASSPFQLTFVFGGFQGWSRIESNRPVFNLSTNEFNLNNCVAAYDGRKDGARMLEEKEGDAVQTGVIFPQAEGNIEHGYVGLKPLLLSFRGLSRAFVGTDTLTTFAVVDFDEAVGALHLGNGDAGVEMWVDDHERGSALRRLKISVGGDATFALVNVTSVRRDESIWFPSSWYCTYYDPGTGRVKYWEHYEVIEHAFNFPTRQDEFTLDFPAGTLVIRNDLQGPQQQFEYIGTDGIAAPIGLASVASLRMHGPKAIQELAGAEVSAWLVANVIAVFLVVCVLAMKYFRSGQ